MKRIFFLVPTVDTAISIVDELRNSAIPDQDIYVVGKDHHRLQMAHLHEAGILQTTGLLRSLKRGLVLGVVGGIILGILINLIIPESTELGIGLVAALGLFGAAFGAWVSTLIGASTPNPRVWKFESNIRAGKLLILIDVPNSREEEIIALVKLHHPEAMIEGYVSPKAKR